MAGGPFSPVSMSLDSAALKAAFKRLGPLAGQEGARAMLPELKLWLSASQAEVPVASGDLKASGRVVVPRVYPDAVVGRVAYGNRGISYAVAVHQIPGRKGYKFLEGPVKRLAAGTGARLGAALGAGIERAAA
jgi:hypothetical protein